MTDRPTIDVYVRLGINTREDELDDTIRVLTFTIPSEFTQSELLDDGWAIDGRSAVYTVTREQMSNDGLLDVQRHIVQGFEKKGYGVTFQ